MDADDAPVLQNYLPVKSMDMPGAIRWAAATQGKPAIRQFAELAAAVLFRRFEPMDYFLFGLYRKDLDRAGRRAILSDRACTALNRSLAPPELRTHRNLVDDKVLSTLVLAGAGLPVPPIRAHASSLYRLESPRSLTSPAEVVAYLRSPGAVPCFGKPVHASRSIGAAGILAIDGDRVTLLNGRIAPVERLAQEIFAFHSEGYVFQDIIFNHPRLAAIVGPTMAGLRLVTVQTPEGPKLLYALLRIPAPGAMVDSSTGGASMVALVDRAEGRILRVGGMLSISQRAIETHPVTGVTMAGQTIPLYAESVDLVLRAHRVLADHGILGWDVAVTAAGPVITETNANPFHTLYQRASNRGFLGPDIAPLIEECRAFCAARRAAMKDWTERWKKRERPAGAAAPGVEARRAAE
ncbi:MAG: hypothetical protein N2422_04095 [Rhodobacteraceae bacterium]|nr:hypothetical protein [Paracoccaceae bacterium]